MSRSLRIALIVLIVTLLVGGPIGHAFYRQANFKRVRVVKEGVLYRSGQLSEQALKQLIHDYGIKTVITLRDSAVPGTPPPDQAEENYCIAQEINYYRIAPKRWVPVDGQIPAQEGVKKFCEVMDNPANYPVLMHCWGGVHRTGAFCAVYRMEYERWSNKDAIEELLNSGYREFDDKLDLLEFVEKYAPRNQGR